jgi:uncharacterized protein YkwD
MRLRRTSVRRPALLLLLTAASCGLAVSAAPAAMAAGCASASGMPAKAAERSVMRTTVCLLNGERASRGLRPLRLNGRLSRAARRHARDMARRKYFSHDSLSGASFVDRIRRAGYLRGVKRWTVGENLAWGSGERATPRSILASWMESPPHRANILDGSFRELGVGLAYDAPTAGITSPAAVYATEFGARR